jgi:hypothetical protein
MMTSWHTGREKIVTFVQNPNPKSANFKRKISKFLARSPDVCRSSSRRLYGLEAVRPDKKPAASAILLELPASLLVIAGIRTWRTATRSSSCRL